ncbi:hypothetical protein [Streptomyces sp. NPDC093149]|uniref:hypothetical protein n=1 Tax=Streptomyces sp. NPDC093149 TaxID=3366031 RepID=UPI00382D3C4B
MTMPKGFAVDFDLRPMNVHVQDLQRLVPEFPSLILTPDFVARTVESTLLRIPLPAAVVSYDNAVQRHVLRGGSEALAALHEFMRQGSEARLNGCEFILPDGWAGATFMELPGRARLRVRETPLRLYHVAASAPDALVASLLRRMNGCAGGETA